MMELELTRWVEPLSVEIGGVTSAPSSCYLPAGLP